MAVGAVAAPPALVDHLDVGDDVLRIEGDLGVVGWKETEQREGGVKPGPDPPLQRSRGGREPLARLGRPSRRDTLCRGRGPRRTPRCLTGVSRLEKARAAQPRAAAGRWGPVNHKV